MALSYEQIRELVQKALGRGYWVMDLYPDRAVVSDDYGDRVFQVSYSVDENGVVTLGDRVEVRREVIYVAMNFQLPEDGSVPEWMQLIPAGEIVQGRDGRTFVNDRPQQVADAFRGDDLDIPIDWEHSTEIKAPEGDQAPAAGWIKDIEVRNDGDIWGRVEWNAKGRESIENKEYRYISPVFIYQKDNRRVLQITSVGLTNKPNLRLRALNRSQIQDKEQKMNWKKLLAKLGLSEDATEDQALNAIATLQGDLETARNRADTPSLDKFVPRADYDQAVGRAANAEQKLKEKENTDLEQAINFQIDSAVKAGKIAPKTRDYYVAMCKKEGGLEEFKKFLDVAPVIAQGSDLDTRENPDKGTAMNAEERKICENLGISEEEYRKANPA